MPRLALLVGAALLPKLLFLFLVPSAASAQPPDAVQVEADTIVYDQASQRIEARGRVRLRYQGIILHAAEVAFDLAQEHLTAHGGVTLIDAQGRELRGESLSYDVRLGLVDIRRAQTIVDRVYIASERIQSTARRLVALDATATTCNPTSPAYRITAREIEVIPRERLTARDASLWIGSVRVLTLPVLTMSLRTSEEIARSLPRIGYSSEEGFWIDYLYGYSLGLWSLRGELYTKYATRLGFIPRNSLRYETPFFNATLTLGRNQDFKGRVFDQAELAAAIPQRQVGASSLHLGGAVGMGLFREAATAAEARRTFARADLSVPSLALGSRTTFVAAISYRHAWYSTGATMATVNANMTVTHRLSEQTSFALSYRVLDVASGASPFLFDTIPDADRVNEATAFVSRSGLRLGRLQSTVFGGVAHNFRNLTTSAVAGFSGRTERFTLNFSGDYNLTQRIFRVSLDPSVRLSRDTSATVHMLYNTSTRVFEEFDYTITVRLCDCFQAVVRYRQVQQEFWLEISLAPPPALQFPEAPPK